jgi:putative nucleotidyltransferase with HDIG domain
MAGLPESSRQLTAQVAKRFAVVGLLSSIVAGAGSYLVTMRHIERVALDRITASAEHFDSPAMRTLITSGQQGDHSELQNSLDKTSFIGIRLFDAEGTEIETRWGQIPATLQKAISSRTAKHLVKGPLAYDWLEIGDETVVRVAMPLEPAGSSYGYLEGYYRIDAETRHAQRQQMQTAGLIGLVSAFSATLLMYPVMLRLMRRTWSLSQSLMEANIDLMQTLGNAIAKRDSTTDAHNYRVTLYAIRLAEALGRPRAEITDLITCAFLHDIGKIGIPDSILLKPGKLTPDEMEVMEKHVVLGQEIIRDSGWLARAIPVIRHHHEHCDGSGYPDGLTGEQIPFGARLFTVVDVFDALTSERSYKRAFSLEESLNTMREGRGHHLDPEIFDVFQKHAAELFSEIGLAFPDNLQQQLSVAVEAYFAIKPAP